MRDEKYLELLAEKYQLSRQSAERLLTLKQSSACQKGQSTL